MVERAILALALALVGLASSVEAAPLSLAFQVEPRVEECLYHEIKQGQKVRAEIVVVRGGKLDVRMKIDAPGKGRLYEKLVFSNVDDASGSIVDTLLKKGHTFLAPSSGNYAFCMDNTMSRWTAKVVDFELEVSGVSPPTPNGATKEVDGMRKSVTTIYDKLAAVEEMQHFLKQREHRHRDTAESTNERIAWYTVAETLVVVGLSAAQVMMVRMWFASSRGLPGGLM